MHGICCYFDVDCGAGVTLSTSPGARETHWKQSTFMLGSEKRVKEGQEVQCCVEMCKSGENPRHYAIVVSLAEKAEASCSNE